MIQPLAFLFKQIHSNTSNGFMLYHIWGSLDSKILDKAESNRAPTATSYTKMDPARLRGKVFGALDIADPKAMASMASRLLDVVSNSEKAPEVQGEPSNALALIVDREFTDAFDHAVYKSLAPYSPQDAVRRLRDDSGLSFLWLSTFKRSFTTSLKAAFPDAADNQIELFWDEYDQLIDQPFLPTVDPIESLGIGEQKTELKRCLNLHVALLMLAALAGPEAHFASFGLNPPAKNSTLPYGGFAPRPVVPPSGARLQPVVMIGTAATDYYTDTNSDPIELDASAGDYVIGRDPDCSEGETPVRVKSSLQNVSRRHAVIAYDIDCGWSIADVGNDMEGSSWGTLILHCGLQGITLDVGTEELLRHGDIVCFAPGLKDVMGAAELVPHIGVENLNFRFETTKPA